MISKAIKSSSRALFFLQCIIKQLFHLVFVISRITKVEVRVISIGLRRITPTSTLRSGWLRHMSSDRVSTEACSLDLSPSKPRILLQRRLPSYRFRFWFPVLIKNETVIKCCTRQMWKWPCENEKSARGRKRKSLWDQIDLIYFLNLQAARAGW